MRLITGSLRHILILSLSIACDGVSRVVPYNFHTVHKNNLYRSNQMNGLYLKKAIKKHKIKTIINLRGPRPGTYWYDNEIKISEKMNVNHVDIAMDPSKFPTRESIQTLLRAYEVTQTTLHKLRQCA